MSPWRHAPHGFSRILIFCPKSGKKKADQVETGRLSSCKFVKLVLRLKGVSKCPWLKARKIKFRVSHVTKYAIRSTNYFTKFLNTVCKMPPL